jgi:GAF domain-containing protein
MVLTPEEKKDRYARALDCLKALFAQEEPDGDTALERFVTALHREGECGLPHFWWCGVYRVGRSDEGFRQLELVMGSSPACSPLAVAPRSGGVCSDCVLTEKPVVVPDVSVYPGHVYCDNRARSEVVVPVFNAAGDLSAVFDADDEHPGSFDWTDVEWIERLCEVVRPFL